MNRQEQQAAPFGMLYGSGGKVESIYIPLEGLPTTRLDIPAEDYDENKDYSFGLARALRAQVILIAAAVILIGIYFGVTL